MLFLILMMSLNLNIFNLSYNFKVGDIAPFTITSSKNMEYIDTALTEEKKDKIKKAVIPVFDLDMTVYDSKVSILEEVVGTINNFTLSFDDKRDKIDSLLGGFIKDKKMEDFNIAVLIRYGRRKGFLERTKALLYSLYQNGIYKHIQGDYNLADYTKKLVPVRLIDNMGTRRDYKRLNEFIYSNISYFEFFAHMQKTLGKRKNLKVYVDLLFALLEDNLYVNDYYTRQEIETRLKRVKPVFRQVKEDEVLVRKGDRINQEALDKIKALKIFRRTNVLKKLIFTFILVLFFLLTLNICVVILAPRLISDHKKSTLFYLFIIFNVFLLYLFFNLFSFTSFPLGIFFPIGFSIYVLCIIMDRKIAFLANVLAALIFLIFLVVYKTDTHYSVFYIFLLGVFMTLLAGNIQRRDQIIQSSLYSVVLYLILTLLYVFYYPNFRDSATLSQAFLWSALNPVISSVVSIGLIPVFEKVFNMITPFRLMELSNLSNKVLSDMQLLAPGTYHHCLFVSNIVEAACKEIGANHLLGRVGALYHDIGKLSNPKYFAENMDYKDNSIHEEISPAFSASILKSHIVEGIRMAKELNLPDEVVRFIPEHHGDSLMEFFYHKAKEQAKENEQIDESKFKYSGKRPQSRETAILMLADGIEAAVRSLKSKRYDLIKEKIDKIINSRINSGALSESPLTLKEIEKVRSVFEKLMFAYYHVRPSYPDDKKNEENNNA